MSQFGCDRTAKSLGDSMRGLASTMQKKWRAGESVKAYLDVFSKENWVKLRQGDELKHSVPDCAPCRGKRHWNDAFSGKSVTCNTKDTARMQKQSQADKKQEERHYVKKFKATMEAQWAASECDFNNLFADKLVSLPTKGSGCGGASKWFQVQKTEGQEVKSSAAIAPRPCHVEQRT